MDSIYSYLQYKSFDCSLYFSTQTIKWETNKEPKYFFNRAEKVGNTLLRPLHWGFALYRNTHSRWAKVAAAIVSFFSTLPALIGVVFKTGGEKFNKDSEMRHNAIAKKMEADSKAQKITQYKIEKKIEGTIKQQVPNLQSLYETNVLALIQEPKQEIEEPEQKPEPIPTSVNTDVGSFMFTTDTQPQIIKAKPLASIPSPSAKELAKKDWETNWENYNKAYMELMDCSAHESLIKSLVSSHKDIETAVTNFFEYANLTRLQIISCLEYNRIIDPKVQEK